MNNCIKNRFSIAGWVLLLTCAGSAADEIDTADHQSIHVLVTEYPPFLGEELPGGGISMQALQRKLTGSSFLIEPIYAPPARIYRMMLTDVWEASFIPPGNVDVKVEHLTIEKATLMLGLFRRKTNSSFDWQDLPELNGGRVAVLNSAGQSQYQTYLLKHGLEVMTTNDMKQGFKLLNLGRVDYVVSIYESGLHVLNELALDTNDFQFSKVWPERFDHSIYINLESAIGQNLADYLETNRAQ